MTAIRLKAVSKTFPGGHIALDGVELTIPKGEFLAVVGPSGSGKSTLLRILAGLCPPTSGIVEFGDRNANLLSPRARDAAILFQNQSLHPGLRVGDNLSFSAIASGMSKRLASESAVKVARTIGLADRLSAWPSQLSGGQKQRVAIGRVMVRRPSLVLLDEPFSNLDPLLRRSMADDVMHLHSSIGATTVLVTHEPREAATLADRIVFLDSGRIVQVGDPNTFRNSPATEQIARFFSVR